MSQSYPFNIDAVYVLSVKKFKDRIQHIEKQTNRIGLNFEFIFEHDANEINLDLDVNYFGDNTTLANPQRSLVLKHIEAWKNCVSRRQSRVLILEDDVIFHHAFVKKVDRICQELDILSDYLVYLGGADTKVPPQYFLATGPIIANPIATTDGYITDLSACEKRLSWLQNNIVTLPSDHLLKKIDPLLGINQYWSTEPLIEQGSVFGLFNTTLDGNRKTKSKLHNLLRYRYKIFTRKVIPKIYYTTLKFLGIYKNGM
jgi:glycosyl transferase family 25